MLASSSSTVQVPQTPCSQPMWVPVSPRSSRSTSTSSLRGSTVTRRGAAVDGQRDVVLLGALARFTSGPGRGTAPARCRGAGSCGRCRCGSRCCRAGHPPGPARRRRRPRRRATVAASGVGADQRPLGGGGADGRGRDPAQRDRRAGDAVAVELDDARRRRRARSCRACGRTRRTRGRRPGRGSRDLGEDLAGLERRRERAAEELGGRDRAGSRPARPRRARRPARARRRAARRRGRRARCCRRRCRCCGSAGARRSRGPRPAAGAASATSGDALGRGLADHRTDHQHVAVGPDLRQLARPGAGR